MLLVKEIEFLPELRVEEPNLKIFEEYQLKMLKKELNLSFEKLDFQKKNFDQKNVIDITDVDFDIFEPCKKLKTIQSSNKVINLELINQICEDDKISIENSKKKYFDLESFFSQGKFDFFQSL